MKSFLILSLAILIQTVSSAAAKTVNLDTYVLTTNDIYITLVPG